MSTIFGEVWRTTFPKGLRYCKQCLIFHAVLSNVVKRYKNKKYIPRSELEDAIAQFEPMPGRPFTTLPVIRSLLCIRFINAARIRLSDKPSWLFTRSVEIEHGKVSAWLEADRRSISNKRAVNIVDREKFVKEVMDKFHVAQVYHRCFRFLMGVVVLLLALLIVETCFSELFYVYLRWYCAMSTEEMLEYFRQVTERHVVCDVPPAYAGKLPSPCVLVESPNNGSRMYTLNVCEFVSPDELHRVICIPYPQVAELSFYKRVGAILRSSDVVVLEGVPMAHISRMPPALLLPQKTTTFPEFGVHHRIFDVIAKGSAEPPKLYPGAVSIGWRQYVMQASIPTVLRMVINPTLVTGTKAEAKVGWGRLRELLAEADLCKRYPNGVVEDNHATIAVPWSVSQIVNLEASLLKMGFTLTRHYSLEWLTEDHLGNAFLKSPS